MWHGASQASVLNLVRILERCLREDFATASEIPTSAASVKKHQGQRIFLIAVQYSGHSPCIVEEAQMKSQCVYNLVSGSSS